MDRTLSRIASFISLKLTNLIQAICLGVLQALFAFKGYHNFSPLYLIVVLFLLPFCLSMFLGRRDDYRRGLEAQEAQMPFPELRKKHNYTILNFRGQSYTFLITVLLHAIWNFNTTASSLPDYPLALAAPMLMLIIYVAVRVFSWLIMIIIYKYFPTFGWKL